jgi:diketogulonate reductase-like aldo/keto reductase
MGHDIMIEGWRPLGKGTIVGSPLIVERASRYGVTPAQLILRWALQHRVIPLPKALNPQHIAENTKLFDFEIAPEDMAMIDAIEKEPDQSHDPDFQTE